MARTLPVQIRQVIFQAGHFFDFALSSLCLKGSNGFLASREVWTVRVFAFMLGYWMRSSLYRGRVESICALLEFLCSLGPAYGNNVPSAFY